MSEQKEAEAAESLQDRIDTLSHKLKNLKYPWAIFLTITAVLASPILFSFFIEPWQTEELPFMVVGAAFGGLFYGGLVSAIVHATRKRRLERQLNLLAFEALGAGTAHLQRHLEENFFTNLVKINFKYIDKYYLQTQVQADKSFALSAFAALVSLIIVVAGIIMLFLGRSEPGYVTAGVGVLGEFIAAVFFALYSRTVERMAEYHQKLVLTQNVSLALKVAEELPDGERAKAHLQLVEYLARDINQFLSPGDRPKAVKIAS